MNSLIEHARFRWSSSASHLRLIMKPVWWIAVVATLTVLGMSALQAPAATEDGVALAIVYDTSGSMKEPVPSGSGGQAPKYVIANRALENVTRRIEAFATNTAGGAPRVIQAGLFVFANTSAREAIRFGAFNPSAFHSWARTFSNPTGWTPLGNALSAAGKAVLDSNLSRKHVLVITDGMSNSGPDPKDVMPKLKAQAAQKEAIVSVHFIAFDVNASVFDPVKKLGATVVSASNETQLNSQLEFILARKILLEDETPPKK